MSGSEITSSDVEAHVLAKIADAPLREEPFPHIYVENVFPDSFYPELLRHIPPRDKYTAISDTERVSGSYENRLVLPAAALQRLSPTQRDFWQSLCDWVNAKNLIVAFLRKFERSFTATVGQDPRELLYGTETMLVKDLDGYQIGPHTDVRSRAVSAMFYLPRGNDHERYGTAMYVPKIPGLCSDGSRHFPFEGFSSAGTIPFRPNSMFAFARSDWSFHGVDPISEPGLERDVLLYILRWRNPAR